MAWEAGERTYWSGPLAFPPSSHPAPNFFFDANPAIFAANVLYQIALPHGSFGQFAVPHLLFKRSNGSCLNAGS